MQSRKQSASGRVRLDAVGFISKSSITVISGLRPLPPFGAFRLHLRHGVKRVTRFSGRYRSPTNRVPLPPR